MAFTRLRRALAACLVVTVSACTISPAPSKAETGLGDPTFSTSSMGAVAYTGALATPLEAPRPMVRADQPVTWWAAFKFNTASFRTDPADASRECTFGGTAQSAKPFSLHYAYASSRAKTLHEGDGLIGDHDDDPVSATFSQIYKNQYFYVVWNDQFYEHPKIAGCTQSCGAPWGHSKGIIAWNVAGEGVVMQVTTPSWPASGSLSAPRTGEGHTLGCISTNNVWVSQHFFSVKLSHSDLLAVLRAMANASVVTDIRNRQLVRSGGPADVQEIVAILGKKSQSNVVQHVTLSSGVQLISKPSALHVPPWQLVSSELADEQATRGISLRVATWWANPKIPTTTSSAAVTCWDQSLKKPGAVVNAETGSFNGVKFGLAGGPGPNFNHAKIGVATSGAHPYTIFGDMNQQGALSTNCKSSQNGRGGMFFVVEDDALAGSVGELIGAH